MPTRCVSVIVTCDWDTVRFAVPVETMPPVILDPPLTDTLLAAYSKGMRRKVVIIAALLHNPAVILFDEPLDGLDANTAMVIKELLKQMAAQGKTVLFCSHILDVVDQQTLFATDRDRFPRPPVQVTFPEWRGEPVEVEVEPQVEAILDDRNRQPMLAQPAGAHLTRGARPEHHDIELLSHGMPPTHGTRRAAAPRARRRTAPFA